MMKTTGLLVILLAILFSIDAGAQTGIAVNSGEKAGVKVNIRETAARNHDELFPNHTSELKVTDPELIEVFDNFAFDEVLRYGDLDKRTRLMMILGSLIASQSQSEYRVMVGDMIDAMYRDSPEDLIHIRKYLSANCFGDFYTRKGLDIKTRELLTFSMILSLGGCESQLKGHVVGNVNVGNGRGTLLLPYMGYPRTLNAIRIINETAPAGSFFS